MPPVDALRRARLGLAALALVTASGTIGYLLLGFSPMNALYQTVTTISTVGFGEIEPMSTRERLFTIVLILGGVGTAIYILSGLVEAVVDGELGELLGRRRVERRIAHWSEHVIICGYGRVGRSIADLVATGGTDVVVVDRDPERLAGLPVATLQGDATDEGVLRTAGIGRARVLVAALTTDADNLFLTVTARSMRPDLFIVARVRQEASESKLASAGADRVVNPQRIGGQRMAAFVLQPTWRSSSTWSCTTGAWSSGSRRCRSRPHRRSASAACVTPTSGTARARWSSPCATTTGPSRPTRPPRP
jgi:voltage-gated potassium channel